MIAWFRIVFINTVIFLFGIIVLELIFGCWVKTCNLNALLVGKNIYRVDRVNHLYHTNQPVTYRRDQYGFRGAFEHPSEVDVLAVGGSTTAERWVDEELTWTARLEQRFREVGEDIRIANAGLDGHSTVAHIRSFEDWFPKIPGLAPKYVIVYVGINDVAVPETGPSNPADNHTYTDASRRAWLYFTNNSAVVHAVKMLLGHLAARRIGVVHQDAAEPAGSTEWEIVEPPETLSSEYAVRLENFDRRLHRLNGLIRTARMTPIYVTQTRGDARYRAGVYHQIQGSNGATELATLRMFNDRLLTFCADLGERCVDISGLSSLGPADFYDNVHANPAGSKKVADFLYEALRSFIRVD